MPPKIESSKSLQKTMMGNLFKKSKNCEKRKKSTTLYELVADHQNFHGWDAVYNRILSHPQEVNERGLESGWYPLQHACYNNPKYPIEPPPANIIKAFLDTSKRMIALSSIDNFHNPPSLSETGPRSRKRHAGKAGPTCAILEACRNPMILKEALEALLLPAEEDFFIRHAHRDFYQIMDRQHVHHPHYEAGIVERGITSNPILNLEVGVCYAKIANQKGVRWANGLSFMMTTINYHAGKVFSPEYPSPSDILYEILSETIILRRHWKEGLKEMFQFCFSKFHTLRRKTDILQLCVEHQFDCDYEAFEYIQSETLHLMRNGNDDEWRLKKYLLLLGANGDVDWNRLHPLINGPNSLLKYEEDAGLLLAELFCAKSCSTNRNAFTLTYLILRQHVFLIMENTFER